VNHVCITKRLLILVYYSSPRCTGNPYFNINNAWQGNFPGAIQCYYCDLGQREARGLPESPVIDDVQMAESTALPVRTSYKARRKA
jgi:hypothetical protein